MEMVPREAVSYENHLHDATLQIHGSDAGVHIKELGLNGGDFPFVLIAVSDVYPSQIMGFSGFTKTGPLVSHGSSLLELRMQKTDDTFYGCGIASLLLDQARTLAESRNEALILEPARPHPSYPLSDGKLREMYKRHGFRELSSREARLWRRKLTDDYLATTLGFEGIDPDTGKLTRKCVCSLSLEAQAAIREIPLGTRMQLMKDVLIRRYGHSSALGSNIRGHMRTVRKYLIREGPEHLPA